MSSTSLLIALLLVVGTLSLRLEDLEVRREYRKGRPEMLWQRGLIPEYEVHQRQEDYPSPMPVDRLDFQWRLELFNT
ncbi:hypothetical protein P5673_025992 [Acropora cervicornis]|uniref:Uncharacterized protein n=1 Tax=Acropora cervicornis TaxID=6130 RepID=A0AAD9Q171_ACRCE|nr:hypothetical protein P5673_025992 [Acropora cervicornis]